MTAATVCVTHGAFIPCRSDGAHRTTDNPYWVKAVRDYQTSTIDGLTWEPAWPAMRTLPDGCSTCGHSRNYCECVQYIDGPTERCCQACTHAA